MKAPLAAGATIAAALFLFFAPMVQVGLTRTWRSNCPDTTALCSIGDSGLLDKGYGSVTCALFGLGGVWDQQLGQYRVLQNGCYVSADGSGTSCYGSCTLNGNGLCAR